MNERPRGAPAGGGIGVWAAALGTSVAAGAGAAYYLHVAFRLTEPGFPLDDTFIHLQFARNLASGNGFAFNPGVPSAGSTAPLWSLLLAIPLAAGLDPFWSAIALATTATVATGVGAVVVVHRLTGSIAGALLAGLAVALSPRMTWASVSGMEVSLYTALVTWTFVAYLRDGDSRRPWWGLLAGLAATARPETLVVGGVLALHWLWRGARRGWRLLPGWWSPLVALAVVVAAFVLLNLYLGGRPLPSTFYAKTYGMGTFMSLMEGRPADAWDAARRYPLEFVNTLLLWVQGQSAFFYLTLLVGALALVGVLGPPMRYGAGVLVVVFLLSPAVKGLVAPEPPLLIHDGRYIAHLLVLFFVICAVGYVELQRRTRVKWVVPLFAMLTLARLASQDVRHASLYARQVENINDLQVRTAQWIAAHTTPEARVATNDIGAIGYLTGRFIIDTEGLVTPAAIEPKRLKKHVEFLSTVEPDLLVIFPQWYPYLAVRTDLFEEVGRVSAPQVVAGAPALVIYRTPWTRPGVLTP